MKRLTVYFTTLSHSSVVAMIRGVSCELATWIATSSEPKVNTTNDNAAVTMSSSVARAPVGDKSRKCQPSQGSIDRRILEVTRASGIVTMGTTHSDDLT